MEFYFSDSNLAKDRFMKNMINSSENGCEYIHVYMADSRITICMSEFLFS